MRVATVALAADPDVLQVSPMAALAANPDLLLAVLHFLGWRDVLRCEPVWAAASSDVLWKPLCQRHWEDKVFLPVRVRELARQGLYRVAFPIAIADSRRTHISTAELCDATWWSRMKGSAGQQFTRSDPWWRGEPVQRRTRFRADSTLVHVTGDEDGGQTHESAAGQWRFVPSCCGLTGPPGSFIRTLRDVVGRETPSKALSRHRGNWGWVMDGCWSVSCSFPMPLRGTDPSMEDAALHMTMELQHDEAHAFMTGLPLPGDE